VVVDTLGLVWGLVVTPASVPDWDGAWEVMLRAKLAATRLTRVFADLADAAIVFWAVWLVRVVVLLVRKAAGQKGFVMQSKRWGWSGRLVGSTGTVGWRRIRSGREGAALRWCLW